MFGFQSPFTRASRGINSTSSLNSKTKKNKESPKRRASEATSEGSGSSIRYIDQEPSVSEGSSTDTLPGIRVDYLDVDPLSPGPRDSLTSPSDVTVHLNGIDVLKDSSSASCSSPSSGNGNLTANNISNNTNNTELSSSTSRSTSSSSSLSPGAVETRNDIVTTRFSSTDDGKTETEEEGAAEGTSSRVSLLSPINVTNRSTSDDLLSIENEFDASEEEEEEEEEEEDDEYEEEDNAETEEASSLPSSPAAASKVVLTSSSTVPYYEFLSVNGCTIRQETTSTSSPQLSTGIGVPTTRSSSCESASSDNTRDPFDDNSLSACYSMLDDNSMEVDSIINSCPVTLSLTPPKVPAARSCNILERLLEDIYTIGTPEPLAGYGPRFKLLEEGDVQVYYFDHDDRTLVRKIMFIKFLRRWETHHIYLNDDCLSSKTATGFLQQPIPYNSFYVEKYAVGRLGTTYKSCLRIYLRNGSLLLQANDSYTRDQWYHSINWKKSLFQFKHKASVSTENIVLRELRLMVEFALSTPLQDERVAGAAMEAVAKLLEAPWGSRSLIEQDDEEKEKIEVTKEEEGSWALFILPVAAPLLERAAPPAALARVLARLVRQHPKFHLVKYLAPAITRCLKHTVDFGKSPDMRKLLQVFVAALYESNDGNDGERAIREYIASVHGPGSDCPHPRVLPNLVSVCVAAIFHRFEDSNCGGSNGSENKPSTLPPLDCYLLVLNVASEYADWRPGLAGLLQPVPFPEEALTVKEVQKSILGRAIRRLAKDSRCTVHQVLLPVREPRPGWLHIAAPSSPACPDRGELFGEMLTTLLACCCRRKRFVGSLMKQAKDDCILLAVRGCGAAQEALCLMLEWRLLPNEEARLQIVNALESTPSGKTRYAALCQRQRNLQELQQKGGPRKLTLPVRATDADVALLLGGRALGNLECLSLAFTSVTSACAEQLIKLPALRYLNLWATQFGDAGLQMISEHLQKLQVLNLCETPVSDKGISTLASLTNLRKLNLNSTKLSAQTFESLKKRLPALQEFDVRYTEAW
ncbi:hypothetical protein HZH66_014777 [Vespula vulgaris]|uniref:C-Maf-inducing protein PH domain-containing protein n=1 Tax=Vespula vulgaris TaxID=7454 RepID=A0A834J160_VESVU|nr:hypothetical protein HZH66_014777 [Vespula vulgaris]